MIYLSCDFLHRRRTTFNPDGLHNTGIIQSRSFSLDLFSLYHINLHFLCILWDEKWLRRNTKCTFNNLSALPPPPPPLKSRWFHGRGASANLANYRNAKQKKGSIWKKSSSLYSEEQIILSSVLSLERLHNSPECRFICKKKYSNTLIKLFGVLSHCYTIKFEPT